MCAALWHCPAEVVDCGMEWAQAITDLQYKPWIRPTTPMIGRWEWVGDFFTRKRNKHWKTMQSNVHFICNPLIYRIFWCISWWCDGRMQKKTCLWTFCHFFRLCSAHNVRYNSDSKCVGCSAIAKKRQSICRRARLNGQLFIRINLEFCVRWNYENLFMFIYLKWNRGQVRRRKLQLGFIVRGLSSWKWRYSLLFNRERERC